MVAVKFTSEHYYDGRTYAVGDRAELSDVIGKRLAKAGVVVPDTGEAVADPPAVDKPTETSPPPRKPNR